MFLSSLPISAMLLISIVAAAGLVYVPFLAVGLARATVGYDTNAPRAMLEQLPDWGKRATWAHQNAWESFSLYTAAALMAYVSGADSAAIRWAVVAYLVARLLFPLFYMIGLAPLRSLMFGVGTISIVTLMWTSIRTALAAG
jgi:uncharacterized MAPEG superfamily protein